MDAFSTVSRHDVEAAAGRLAGVAVRTPLLRSDALDALTGGRLWLKPECLQRTGSFKFRGAYNRLVQLATGTPVVAYSSGNHAQGVALAARLLGHPATIVMPADAPAAKVAATRGYGATVVLYDRLRESREAIAAEIAGERAVVVPPFADVNIIAGQGTVGLEIAADLARLGEAADMALVCCGGGGLASGVAIGSGLPVVAVEPEGYDDVARSLVAGHIVPVDDPQPTLCDALQTLTTEPLPFGLLQAAGARGVAVTEAQVLAAMRFAFEHLKLVVEPGGAVALAAAIAGVVPLAGRTAVVVLSGGNVDPATFARCLE